MFTNNSFDNGDSLVDVALCDRVSRRSADGRRLARTARHLAEALWQTQEEVRILKAKLRMADQAARQSTSATPYNGRQSSPVN